MHTAKNDVKVPALPMTLIRRQEPHHLLTVTIDTTNWQLLHCKITLVVLANQASI